VGAVKSIQPQERACLSGLFFRKRKAGATTKLQPTGMEQRIFPSPTLPLPMTEGGWHRGQPPEHRARRERAGQKWRASKNIWQVSLQGCSQKGQKQDVYCRFYSGWHQDHDCKY